MSAAQSQDSGEHDAYEFARALTTCALLAAVGCTGPAADPEQGPAAQGAGAAPRPANVSACRPRGRHPVERQGDQRSTRSSPSRRPSPSRAIASSPSAATTTSRAGRSGDATHRPAGRAVVPGMIDNHAHYMEEGVLWTDELRLDNVTTRAQAIEMMKAKAASLPADRWVYTLGGWSPDQFTDDKKSVLERRTGSDRQHAPGAAAVHALGNLREQQGDRGARPREADGTWIKRDASGKSIGVIDAWSGRICAGNE